MKKDAKKRAEQLIKAVRSVSATDKEKLVAKALGFELALAKGR